VLKSIAHGSRYIGSTNDLAHRLKEHNQGRCKYTKGRMPWELIYTETFEDRADAMKRERFLKSGQGRKFLDGILK
jgi:putative endonuclease